MTAFSDEAGNDLNTTIKSLQIDHNSFDLRVSTDYLEFRQRISPVCCIFITETTEENYLSA